MGCSPDSDGARSGRSTGARRAGRAPPPAAARRAVPPSPRRAAARARPPGHGSTPGPLPLPRLGGGSAMSPARYSRSRPTWALISLGRPRTSVQSSARHTRRAISERCGGSAATMARRIRSRSASVKSRPHSLLGIRSSISSHPIGCVGAGFQKMRLSVSGPGQLSPRRDMGNAMTRTGWTLCSR